MIKKKVYLAGAISGQTYDESQDWREFARIRLLNFGINAYSPLRAKEYLKDTGILDSYDKSGENPLSTSRGVMTRDFNDVQTAEALLVYLAGTTNYSAGTAMEMAWAWYMHKPVVVVAEEDNIHMLHPMIKEATSFRVADLEEGIDIVRTILLP